MRAVASFLAAGAVVVGLMIAYEAILAKLGLDGALGEFVVMVTFAALVTAWWWDYGRGRHSEESKEMK